MLPLLSIDEVNIPFVTFTTNELSPKCIEIFCCTWLDDERFGQAITSDQLGEHQNQITSTHQIVLTSTDL